jgi:arabinogalactan oligomer / maltooligosaccharide transport system permease protein
VKARQLLLHPVAVGLLLAVALGVLLSEWFFAQAQDEMLAQRQEREVVMQAMAFADLVAAVEAVAPDTGAPRLAALATAWSGRFGDITALRVVRSADSLFLASTDPGDARPLPRRLARGEKPLYDLGQALRANVETNAAEGVFRKKQIDVVRLDRARLRVALPYAVDGKVVGFVQMEQRVAAPMPPSVWGRAVATVGAPLLLFLIIAWVLPRRVASPGKPWGLYALALLLLGAAFYGAARDGFGELRARHEGFAVELAQNYLTIKHEYAVAVAGYAIAAEAVTRNRWDVDDYQRPRGIITAAGALDRSALKAELDARTARLARGLWGNAVVSLLLLSFVALGYGRRLRQTLVEHKTAYYYVAPAILGMLVLVFFPFVYGVALSFTDSTLFNENLPLRELWSGVRNYVAILGDFQVVRSTAGDWVVNYQNFYWTLFVTIAWTLCNVTIGVSVGLLLALALNTKGLRYTNVYRVLLILPWAIPNYITALTWRGMFHKQYGVINQAIQMFGGEPIAWFDGVFTSFVTGIATNGWLSFPFMMVVILGGLQAIPQDAYEAARVEGANRWQQFRHITLPYLRPTLIPAIIISVVWTFNMFNIIYLVSGGEPAGSNEILITQAYKIAFEKYQYGYAAAYSVVIFLILLVYGVFQNRVTRATEAIA